MRLLDAVPAQDVGPRDYRVAPRAHDVLEQLLATRDGPRPRAQDLVKRRRRRGEPDPDRRALPPLPGHGIREGAEQSIGTERSVEWTRERVQFERPIGDDETDEVQIRTIAMELSMG